MTREQGEEDEQADLHDHTHHPEQDEPEGYHGSYLSVREIPDGIRHA